MTAGADELKHEPPPVGARVGAKAIGRQRVRLMIAEPCRAVLATGRPVAFHEMEIRDAVQVVQALRQAINDARLGVVRPDGQQA